MRYSFTLYFLVFAIGINSMSAQFNWSTKNLFEQKNFIENKGQVTTTKLPNKETVLYTAFLDGVTYYFTRNGYTISHIEKQEKTKKEREEDEKRFRFKKEREKEEKEFSLKFVEKFHELKWENANPNVLVVSEHPVKNYYTYSDPASPDKKGTILAHAYTRLIYKGLYPFTDVVFEFPTDSSGIKYSIYLHPGADVEKIKMSFPGEAFKLNESNDAVITSVFGTITDHAPISYTASSKVHVASKFKITADQLGFELKPGAIEKTIVIDPWTTIPDFGSSSSAAYDVDYDNLGNVYAYGGTAFSVPYLLLKFDPSGTLIWSYSSFATGAGYYGDFAVDRRSNNVYLTEGFNPTTGANVIKLNSSGTVLTTFGGDSNFIEMWRIGFSRCTNQAVIAGGGTSMITYQTCYLDTSLASLSPVSYATGGLPGGNDIGLLTLDNLGNCYQISTSNSDGLFDDQLVKMPLPALLPLTYNVNTGYSFNEGSSITYGSFIGYNGLTTSNKYVYSYDSYVLKKWDGPTGNLLVYKRINYPAFSDSSQIHWGGISADDCGNLFVADSNTVLQYDSTLTLLNSYLMPGVITDVNLSNSGDVYVCGLGFVSTFTPTGIISCASGGMTDVSSAVAATCTAPGSASVTVSGGVPPYIITWSTFPVQHGPNAINLAPGSYPVTITDAACPPHRLVDTVIVPALGGAYLSVPSINSGCPGLNNGSIVISNTGGVAPYSYAWTPVAADTNGIYNLSPGSYYSVTITDNAGCTNTFDSMLVDTPAVMHFSFTHGPIKCFNDTTTLTILPTGGDTPYTINWTTPSATGLHLFGAGAGNYAGIITDNSGCILPFTDTLRQPPLLTATITSVFDSVCPGTSVSLSASGTGGTGTYTYLWTSATGTGTTTSYTYIPTATDTVLLSITDFNSCVATTQHIITLLTLSDPTITPVPVQCVSAPSITLAAATSGGTWSGDGITDATNGIFNPGTAGVGSHVITYTLTRPCLSVDTVTIVVVRQLSATITDVGPFCTGTAPVTLHAVDAGGVWSGVGITNTATGVFNPAVAGVGSFTIIYTLDTLCGDIDSTTIVVMAAPVISFEADTTEGCEPTTITFTSTVDQPDGTSLWNFGDGNTSTLRNPSNTYASAGTYSVTFTYTNAAGCATTVTQNDLIIVHSQPVAIYTADPQPTTIVDPTIHFTDHSTGLVNNWQWTFGTGDGSSLQNPTYTYIDTGAFSIHLVVTNDFGCTSSTSGVVIINQILLLYAPNAFTPDGNGINDFFAVKGEDIDLTTFEMRIFDRWGEMVYRTDDITKGWNGTKNNTGPESKQDVYVWKVDFKDYSNIKHTYIGRVMLMK